MLANDAGLSFLRLFVRANIEANDAKSLFVTPEYKPLGVRRSEERD